MRNKKIILGIGIFVGILLVIISIIIIKSNKTINFQSLLNAKSYNVDIKYYRDPFNDGEYILEEEDFYNFDFTNDYEFIQIDDDKFYNYKGKQIFSKEIDNNDLVWFYYEPQTNYFISFPGSDNKNYKESFINLFEVLSDLTYTKKGNVYINTTNIDERINNYAYDIYPFKRDGYVGDIETHSVVDKIEIVVENNNIKRINFYIVKSCLYEYPDLCDFDYEKLELIFNDINKNELELPLDVRKSLEQTTAGDWLGTYSYETPCLNCSEPQTIKNYLNLTDKFDFHSGRGWNVEYSLYDGKYISNGTDTYYFENNNFYIVDNDEILKKGRIIDDKIEIYDEKGNVSEIFVKE